MCALCGGLIGGRHWADTGGDAARSGQRERGARIRLLNRVLRHYEMEVRAWDSDSYLLTGKGMPSLLAANLPTLWAKVEEARGVSCTPLDQALLAELSVP